MTPKKEYDRIIGEPYLYQINKIYEVVNKGGDEVEKEIDSDLKSRHIFLPDRPESTKWKNEASDDFFTEIANFRNSTLQKSLNYLYEGAIGHLHLNEPEKMSLDLFKAIEVIIEYFAPYSDSGRRKPIAFPKWLQS